MLTIHQAELRAIRNKPPQNQTNKRVKVEPKLPKGLVSSELIDLT